MPRSHHRPVNPSEVARYPPWNPSPKIDHNGFLIKNYERIPGEWEKEFKVRKRHQVSLKIPVTIRQVPGDGNCLFHSISTCYAHAVNGTHLDMRDPGSIEWLYESSSKLRKQAVECLQQHRKLLFLQGHEYLKARDLVEAAASQYAISGEDYCRYMQQDSYWGGGPEIVALSNVLQRPIHVYELCVGEQNNFVLRRMACFGSPKFDRRSALHILSADSRFPDVQAGKQMASGNHFLAIFPTMADERIDEEKKDPKSRRRRIRGGDDDHRPHWMQRGHRNLGKDATDATSEEDPTAFSPRRHHRWWSWRSSSSDSNIRQ